ncbi:hypothetical protein [Bacillus sp. SJS]|uniref:hypothetical protein n=1 Tax=Bacillus sp. SJS TaxID=1423321 RepID=UPI0004DCC0A2|nr:hypothetical protein [Bacillus sp. SJS]KZZ85766.1 hypothetical protein AS29_004030 [Bacillus sp. SJS]
MISWRWDPIDKLENQKEWEHALQYMRKDWKNGKKEVKNYIRYSFLNWYLLTEGEVVAIDNSIDKECHENLKYLYNLGQEEYFDNPYFLALYGYMTSITPYILGDDTEYWLNKSSEMLKKGSELSNDPFLMLLNIGNISPFNQRLCNQIFMEYKDLIESSFDGEGVFQEYFLGIIKSLAHN